MSNQPNTNKEELLKSIKTALRGTSILLDWIIFAIFIPIIIVAIAGAFAGVGGSWSEVGSIFAVVGYIGFLVGDIFIIVYTANLVRRGLKGIGLYYNNQTLISGATHQFILWILMIIIAPIILIPLGIKMGDISKTLYDLTGIKDFDVAKERWRWAAYLAIILVGGLIALFALHSTREGFKEMINQMAQ